MRLLLVLFASAVLFEVYVRFALLHDSELAAKLGRGMRNPGSFAHRLDDSYWKLQSELNADARKPPNCFDPELGWTKRRVPPGSYEHADFVPDDGRRPVLLFGDSFAACVTEREECWEGLMRSSDIADRYQLLNYGVGGYGFDQAYMLYERAIDRYAELDPIVIVGVLVDDDLDRCRLGFRGWPKPRFVPEGADGLALADNPILDSVEEYIDEVGIGIPWYSWSYLLYGTDLLPRTWRRTGASMPAEHGITRDLSRRILTAWQADLEARGFEAFALLFHGKAWLDENKHDWRDAFLVKQCEHLGLAYQSSKVVLREDARATGRRVKDYFIVDGPGRGHYTPLGNEVVFRALRAGLEGP